MHAPSSYWVVTSQHSPQWEECKVVVSKKLDSLQDVHSLRAGVKVTRMLQHRQKEHNVWLQPARGKGRGTYVNNP